MTENKRFILVDIGFVRDNGKLIGMKDIVAIMNELHDENEQLKSEIKDFQELLTNNENELLKPVIRMIDDKIIECEQAVEEIRTGERDSYIVKHDVASKILKELKKELKR